MLSRAPKKIKLSDNTVNLFLLFQCVNEMTFDYFPDTYKASAINLGGEILRWSIEGINKDLYKQEPYKRLWILGKPCIVKFKCKLSEIYENFRVSLIAEIVEYFIVTKMYGFSYEFEFMGMTIGSVPPENIISIEEIENFIEIQGEYEDEGFYSELNV